ncbi:hypothetical protein [Emticicia sp. 17c]|uniref:hypothetical protein n=1 Tax=Emticicia sp. 17c TaxID=3127704 RepID=UPI00301C40A5
MPERQGCAESDNKIRETTIVAGGWAAAWGGMTLAAVPAAKIGAMLSPGITPLGGAIVGGAIILGTGIVCGLGGEELIESLYDK